MKSGNMIHKVAFYGKVISRDTYGSSMDTWPLVTINTRCELREVGGNKELSNEEKTYTKNKEITLRYRSDIVETMKVQLDGTNELYFITYIEIIGRKEGLKLSLERCGDDLSGVLVDPPTLLTANINSDTIIDIEWNNNDDNDGVIIETSTDGNTFTQLYKAPAEIEFYRNIGLTANTKYYYRARSYKYSDYSTYTDVISATTLTTPVILATWGGTVGTSFDGGTGTITNPYLISSGETLAYLASIVNAGATQLGLYFKQTINIDLASIAWTPIGTTSPNYFRGFYDGDGYKIYNLIINRNLPYNGLFGYIFTGAIIRNTGIESGTITSSNYTGGIVGDCYGASIIQCYNNANINGFITNPSFHGGIAGRITSTSNVTNCYNRGNISTSLGFYVGGITGYQNAGNITNCYSSAIISSTASKFHGGIIGFNNGGNIYHCYYDNTLCPIGAINYVDVVGSADGLSTTIMKTESTFSTYWDMVIWEMNTTYPELTIFDSSPSYYKADGLLTQTGVAVDTFAGAKIHAGTGYKKLIRGTVPHRSLSGKKFMTFTMADFYDEDLMFAIPLFVKYGFSSSVYTPTKFADDNPLALEPELNTNTNLRDYKRIISSASYISAHYFQHYTWGVLLPMMDGTNYPSNDDLRVERADGTNAFGYDVDATLLDTYGSTTCGTDYLNIVDYQTTAFKDLSDAQCLDIRHKLSYFYGTDYRFDQNMIQILDYYSNLYCGTTGYSVKAGDYTTKIPNTVGGVYPNTSNRIQGGIFQGAATLQNHEIWERFEVIFQKWTNSLGRDYKIRLMVTSGGWLNYFFYIASSPASTHIKFHDRELTNRANCFSSYESSILNTNRCYGDIIKDFGFVMGPGGYTGYGWTDYDGQQVKEKAVLYKLGSDVTSIDYIGDGYHRVIRPMDYTLADDVSGFAALLASNNIMKDKFELTAADETATALTSGNNFAQVINEVDKRIAWGLIPEVNEDLGVGLTNKLERRAHLAIVIELYCQYCKANGIEIISAEEAVQEMYKTISYGTNIFPNAEFRTTAKDYINSTLCNEYPDGWDAGSVVLDGSTRTYTTNVKSYIRNYIIQNGTGTLTLSTKGSGTIDIYLIRNSHSYWVGAYEPDSTCNYELYTTITVDSVDWVTQTVTIALPLAPIKVYTTETQDYQNYMKGLDDRICGMHIEVVPTTTISIKSPSLTVL